MVRRSSSSCWTRECSAACRLLGRPAAGPSHCSCNVALTFSSISRSRRLLICSHLVIALLPAGRVRVELLLVLLLELGLLLVVAALLLAALVAFVEQFGLVVRPLHVACSACKQLYGLGVGGEEGGLLFRRASCLTRALVLLVEGGGEGQPAPARRRWPWRG